MTAALDAIICIDTAGNITFWNPQAEKIFGWQENEVMGRLLSEIIIPEPFRKMHDNGIKNYLNTGVGPALNILLELKAVNRQNKEFPIELTVLPIKQGGEEFFCAFVRDITERKRATEEIKNSREQLRHLTAHLQSIREEERKRIGREIHDELGQQLTAIKMYVAWIDKKIPAESVNIKSRLENILELLDGSNQSLRRILSELRPGILDDYGLIDGLEFLNRQFAITAGINVAFTATESKVKMPEEINTCIFRIYQEALTNITKYAGAKKVITSLTIMDDVIVVSIEDDGNGFELKEVKDNKSFGLLGMKERVYSLNGTFNLISSPGNGTQISILLPYVI